MPNKGSLIKFQKAFKDLTISLSKFPSCYNCVLFTIQALSKVQLIDWNKINELDSKILSDFGVRRNDDF